MCMPSKAFCRIRKLPNSPPSDEKILQTSAYAATRLYPRDQLAVIAGGRWNRYQYDYILDDPYDPIRDHMKSSKFSPYVGAVYALNDRLSLYAAHSRTFKPQLAIDVNGRVLAPEVGSNIEAGVKGALFNERLNASAALFETRKNNMAVRIGINADNRYFYAPHGTKTRGVEIELGGSMNERWRVQGGYTYAQTTDNTGDNPVPYLPRHQIKLFTDYAFTGRLSGLRLGTGLRWQSATREALDADAVSLSARANADPAARACAENAMKQKAYAVIDVQAAYTFGKQFEAGLALNNVFDTHYRTSPANHSDGEPRNLKVTLRYRF